MLSRKTPCPRTRSEDESWATPEDAPLIPDRHEVAMGHQNIVDADDGEVCQQADALPEPTVPTRAEVEAHKVTHLPYRSWCKWCVMARRRAAPHRRSQASSRRSIPLLVADYCYMRDCHDTELATVLVVKLYPAKAIIAICVARRGISKSVINRVAKFVKDSGYLKVAYMPDQEASIRVMLEAAVLQAGRE